MRNGRNVTDLWICVDGDIGACCSPKWIHQKSLCVFSFSFLLVSLLFSVGIFRMKYAATQIHTEILLIPKQPKQCCRLTSIVCIYIHQYLASLLFFGFRVFFSLSSFWFWLARRTSPAFPYLFSHALAGFVSMLSVFVMLKCILFAWSIFRCAHRQFVIARRTWYISLNIIYQNDKSRVWVGCERSGKGSDGTLRRIEDETGEGRHGEMSARRETGKKCVAETRIIGNEYVYSGKLWQADW